MAPYPPYVEPRAIKQQQKRLAHLTLKQCESDMGGCLHPGLPGDVDQQTEEVGLLILRFSRR
jgi:hypothetical protein